MISILLLLLMSTSTESQSDWCKIIKPNNTYNGLGMYWNHTNSTLKMFNRAGNEWTVAMNDTILIPDLGSIELNKDKYYHKINLILLDKYYECYINQNVPVIRDSQLFRCTNDPKFEDMKSMENLMKYVFVIWNYEYGLFVHRNNLEDFWALSLKEVLNKNDSQFCHKGCDDFNNISITEVNTAFKNSEIFSKIDVIIRLSDKNKFVILYNIEGRPKYCITTSLHSCTNEANLKSLFDDCFSKTSKTSTVMTSTTKRPKVILNFNPPKYRYKVLKKNNDDYWTPTLFYIMGFVVIIITAVFHKYMVSKEKQRQNASASRYKPETKKKTPNLTKK